jgi:hypothetical protein
VIDVVEEAFDIKEEDASLEASCVRRLYIVDEGEASV